MLTLEWKCFLTQEQESHLQTWLDLSKAVWNMGLAALKRLEEYRSHYDPITKTIRQECPIYPENQTYFVESRQTQTGEQGDRIIEDRRKKKHGRKVEFPCCTAFARNEIDENGVILWGENQRRRTLGLPFIEGEEVFYPARHWYSGYVEPIVKTYDFRSLQAVIKGEYLKQYASYLVDEKGKHRIPYKYCQAIMRLLATSWKEYRESVKEFVKHKEKGGKAPIFRGEPQFKRPKDKINTLVFDNGRPEKGKGGLRPDIKNPNLLLGMPGFPEGIKVPGLEKRWRLRSGELPEASVGKVIKRPSGYYIQLTLDTEKLKWRTNPRVACGIDVGLRFVVSTDNPDKPQIKPPKYLKQSLGHLRRLQRTADRKRRELMLKAMRELTADEILARVPKLTRPKAEAIALAKPKTHAQLVKALFTCYRKPKSVKDWRQLRKMINQTISMLKWRLAPPSKKLQKLNQRLSKTHEKIKLQRRNFNHKISTYLVRTYGAIVVEDIRLTNLIRKNDPKLREDGKGYARNNQAAKRGMNRSFVDVGIGQLLEMLEQKCLWAGREFIKIPPQYTTQTCPNCQHKQKMPLSTRWRICENCGCEGDRDFMAAINIRLKGEKQFKRSYLPSKGLQNLSVNK